MEKLQKECSIARSIFTRNKNKFIEVLTNEKDNQAKLRSCFDLLTKKAQALFSIDELIKEQWMAAEEYREEDIIADSESADVYEQDFLELKHKYEGIVQPMPSESHYGSASVSGCETKHTRRLPKLELTKFDGQAINWLGFWSSFKKIHNYQSIDDDDKMAYLTQSMVSESAAYNLIKSFPPCGENYTHALEQLKMRYGRDELLIEIYVRELLSLVLQQAKETNTLPITELYDKLKTQLRALELLGVTSEKYAAMLYPLVESALPEEILRVWERQRQRGDGADILRGLLEFVKIEVESEERIQLARKSLKTSEAMEESKIPTAACLVAGEPKKATSSKPSNNTTVSCIWCEKPSHSSLECYKAPKMTVATRREIAEKKRACFACLRVGHNINRCRSAAKCIACQKRHAVLLCPDIGKTSGASSSENAELMLTSKSNGTTLLQTLTVKIGDETVRAFIDTGAQRSYIRKDIAMKLEIKPSGEEVLRHCLFGGMETKQESHQVFDLVVKDVHGKSVLNMTALSKDKICGYVPRIRNDLVINQKLKHHNLTLTDVGENTPEVGLLIGADYAGKIMTGTVIHLNEDLHAIQTKLGWTLQGIVARQHDSIIATVDLCDNDIHRLWDLESLGIEDPKTTFLKSKTREEAIEAFKESVIINKDERYVVALPWKVDRPELSDNRGLAEKRLNSTTKRLQSLNEFGNYSRVFQEWLELGIIEIDPDVASPGHYLSHHAVIKESSLTTRVRPVFDASARDFNGNSINMCLEKGQNFLELIPTLLTRFRIHAVGITSDIKKAFLQIAISEEDRKYLRFLWWSNERDMIVYRHCRVVFGLTCSPFLLAATLIYHLDKYASSDYADTAQTLKESFYVDNCVMSVESQEEAEKFINESKHLMEEGKFDLRGWVTAPVKCKNTDEQKTISVLGVTWDTEMDELHCSVGPLRDYGDKITRRELLSICNRIFDPIGFTSPTTLVPKLLLQRSWCIKTGWDSELPDDICKEFKTWMDDIHCLKECRIPRRLTSTSIEESKNTLHIFSDASKSAYATCIFLRSETDEAITVQLVLAKSRVTPVKEVSIPRLELIAALMSTRIYVQTRDALRLENCKAYFWTDSSVAMTWIVTNKDWNVFVKNRVNEIREVTKPADWRHIKGTLNPADLPSRGCCGKRLLESRWWEGPAWLKESEEKWPSSTEMIVKEEDVNKELKKVRQVVNNTDIIPEFFTTCLNNMSKYTKIVRTVAWILRFYQNCKSTTDKMTGDVTFEETEKGEKLLLRVVQEETFRNKGNLRGMKDLDIVKDEDALLRVRTRLTLCEGTENFKAPILLSGKHPIVERLVEQRHRQHLHSGVYTLFTALRDDYWILGGKKLAKKIISRCIICKRYKVGNYKTPTAPLPDNRVRNTGVFQVTGVDAAGPLILKTGEKSWIILFTCAVYRAVHLELVISMSTECFIMALRRFIARRGRVEIIYSDNGTNFVGAENLLTNVNWEAIQKYSTIHKIKWIFNPPAAPWWGGWWERIIRMVKELLRRNLGKASLTFIEIETLICDIESVINSRPLTYVAEEDTLRPLTPETFLHSLRGTEVADLDAIDVDLNVRQKYLQKLRANLRQRFRDEYLALLVSRTQEANNQVQVGDVVIMETEAKRMNWPLGIVEEIHAGKDGHYRVAKVKTTDGHRTRPVQRLYPLEVSSEGNPEKIASEKTSHSPGECNEDVHEGTTLPPLRSTRGRLLKVPRRLDL